MRGGLTNVHAKRVLGFCLSLAAPGAFAQVFINEFHYDNDGTDSNERIEVIAPAGTNLSGWKVVLYNGADGRAYLSLNLSGTTANQCNGYGTVNVAATGMQNGAPDGLALVNASNALVQFLSYEGSFNGVDGAAAGRASSNIGVSESGLDPVGRSLQLSGTGTVAANFSWNAPRTSSFGACNLGQSFTAPDAAPTVTSTSPSNGATAVARSANLTVAFSEPVTAATGWLTLSCPSGARTLTATGGPSTYTLDPTVDFAANETCTATVQANRISDQDNGSATPMANNVSFSFTTVASGGTGYYASVNTTSAALLRSTLHNLIDDHTKIPYTATTTDVWDVLERAEQDPLNPSRVLDIYKNASYAKAGGGNNFYNREHTWPKSLGFPDDTATNFPYSDTHMLMASDIGYNSDRGNLPLDDCSAACTERPTQAYAGQGGGTGVYPGNSNWFNGSVFQVWAKKKGDVARAVLYMDIRYEGGTNGRTGSAEPNLQLTDNLALVTGFTSNTTGTAYMGKLSTLLRWSAEDPPTEAERLRNDLIFSYQGNRNPFVDNPQWLDCIYRNICQ